MDLKSDMSFSVSDIIEVLWDYEKDNQTGMNIQRVSELIYYYTSGYPFLVARICKIMDEELGEQENWA